MAVLYRTNAQSRIPEEVLMQAGIPYKVFGGQKFYERKEIKDILAYLRVIANPSDDISLTRIINVPKRSIGDTTVQLLTEHAAGQGIPLYAALAVLPDELGSRAKNSVNEFFRMMTMLCAMKESMELEAFIDEMIRITGLEEQYRREDTDEAMARLENIQEFRGSVHEFVQMTEGAGLEEYLENVALVTDLDRDDGQSGYAVLMTLHSAKGLEFDNVFIPGMEEGIFPSARSLEEENRLEEERRLMYVGITRARRRLYLTRASERMLYNQYGHNPPSRFLEEIPPRLVREEFSHSARFGTGRRMEQRARRYESEDWEIQDFPDTEPRTSISAASLGKPKLKIKGHDLSSIPGVSRGFVGSNASQFADSAMQKLFTPGDRVRHPKFGAGIVKEVSGFGKEARIRILFETAGEKELALSIAPIVKTEETE